MNVSNPIPNPSSRRRRWQFPHFLAPAARAARRRATKLIALVGIAGALVGPREAAAVPAALHHDYADALAKSFLFYEAQRSGAATSSRVPWRKAAALGDGGDVGVDLSGGWFDAGDHVKFGLPMAYTATMLAWSLYESPTAYESSGQTLHARANLRFALDYFLQAYREGASGPADDVFFHQVGDPNLDHAFWGPPEKMTMPRPTHACTAASPCSEVTAATAAALAAGSTVFSSADPAYATLLRQRAESLYEFADAFRSSAGYTAANGFYTSYSGFWDELAWGATWLFAATGDSRHLDRARAAIARADSALYWAHSWDNVANGSALLLARFTGDQTFAATIETHLDHWCNSVTRTPGGLAWLSPWGSLRYASTTAFLALAYSNQIADESKRTRYRGFALRQIDYILGDNPRGSSYVVGYGVNPPRNPHHRGAHDSPTFTISSPLENLHELTGALVGGPASADDFDWADDRTDYVRNEVAVDYNAGYTAALAAILVLADESSAPPTLAPTASPSPTHSPTGAATPPAGILDVRTRVQSDWSSGYCRDVFVTNRGNEPVDWTVTIPVEGVVRDLWNGTYTQNGNQLTVSGAAWNDVVQPGATAAFGFCAERTVPLETATRTASPTARKSETPSAAPTRTFTAVPTATRTIGATDVTVRVVVQSDWSSGYCAEVRVHNSGYAPADWVVSFPVEGTVRNVWNALYSVDGALMTARGLEWNDVVAPGQTVAFGFCADR